MVKKHMKAQAASTFMAPSVNWHIAPYAGNAVRAEDVVVRSISTAESPHRGASYDGFFLNGVQFNWCSRGKLRLRFSDGKPLVLNKGQFAVVYGQRTIRAEALVENTSHTNVVLSGLDAMDFADELGLYDGFVAQDAMPVSSIHSLNDMVNRQKTDNNVSNAVVMNLVSNMLISVLDRARMRGMAKFLNTIRCFNDHFLQNDFSVNSVADELGVSPNTLYLLFRSHGFESPGAFAEARQLRRAQAMLANSRVKIKEIARCCGFTSPAHFSVFIRKHFGHTPRELRNGNCDDLSTPAKMGGGGSKVLMPNRE